MDMKDLGISISVPKEAINSLDYPLELSIQPCLTGHFVLPRKCEAASPAYLIQLRDKEKFQRDINMIVRIQHYTSLESEGDCEAMQFLSASSTPEFRGFDPVYVFREIDGTNGIFKPGSQFGERALKSLGLILVAKRVLERPRGTIFIFYESVKMFYFLFLIENMLYSLRLFPTVQEESVTEAIFYCCVSHPVYIKVTISCIGLDIDITFAILVLTAL